MRLSTTQIKGIYKELLNCLITYALIMIIFSGLAVFLPYNDSCKYAGYKCVQVLCPPLFRFYVYDRVDEGELSK
jgi:hypothetical protein